VWELPDAPLYIVLSLDADDIDKWYARLEAGFVAGNILLQGSAVKPFIILRHDMDRKLEKAFEIQKKLKCLKSCAINYL